MTAHDDSCGQQRIEDRLDAEPSRALRKRFDDLCVALHHAAVRSPDLCGISNVPVGRSSRNAPASPQLTTMSPNPRELPPARCPFQRSAIRQFAPQRFALKGGSGNKGDRRAAGLAHHQGFFSLRSYAHCPRHRNNEELSMTATSQPFVSDITELRRRAREQIERGAVTAELRRRSCTNDRSAADRIGHGDRLRLTLYDAQHCRRRHRQRERQGRVRRARARRARAHGEDRGAHQSARRHAESRTPRDCRRARRPSTGTPKS